jgi:hypothetical protein
VIAGSEAGSLWHSKELHAKAAGPKELFIVKAPFASTSTLANVCPKSW